MRTCLLVIYAILFAIDNIDCQTFSLVPAMTWNDARTACRSNGRDLVMPKDSATWSAALSFISTNHPSISEFWMGLKWSTETRKFYWVDCGELGTYENWDDSASNEPNCMTGTEVSHPVCPAQYDQDCVRVKNGLWKTHGCYNTYHGICVNVGYTLPLTCPEPTTTSSTQMTSVEQSTTMTQTSTTEKSGSTTTLSTEMTSTEQSTRMTQTSPTEKSETTEAKLSTSLYTSATSPACVYVCPGDSVTTTTTMAAGNKATTVPITETLKLDKKKTGAYIRAHTSAYDGRLSSKLIGLTGAGILCSVVILIICLDATRIMGYGNMHYV